MTRRLAAPPHLLALFCVRAEDAVAAVGQSLEGRAGRERRDSARRLTRATGA